MDHEQQIDHAEHRYWANQCPACDGPTSQCDGHDDSTTSTYWISIGRNTSYGGTLIDYDWSVFRARIRYTVRAAWIDGSIIAEVSGQSTWEGVAEDTHLFLVTVPTSNVAPLRAHLQKIAQRYHQDAIGLVGGPGTDTLVTAS